MWNIFSAFLSLEKHLKIPIYHIAEQYSLLFICLFQSLLFVWVKIAEDTFSQWTISDSLPKSSAGFHFSRLLNFSAEGALFYVHFNSFCFRRLKDLFLFSHVIWIFAELSFSCWTWAAQHNGGLDQVTSRSLPTYIILWFKLSFNVLTKLSCLHDWNWYLTFS